MSENDGFAVHNMLIDAAVLNSVKTEAVCKCGLVGCEECDRFAASYRVADSEAGPVAAPTAALIESERLDLLRRVAEAWPGADLVSIEGTTPAIPYVRLDGRGGDALLFLRGDDALDARAIILMRQEIVRQGWTLSMGYDEQFGVCAELTQPGQHIDIAREDNEALVVSKAFVAVMEAVKG